MSSPSLLVRAAAWSVSLVLLLAAPLVGQRIENPELFTKSLEAATEALKLHGADDDAEDLERVNRIGYELAQESGFDKFPFTFFVVEMPIPNAFALPGGHIFVTRGMLDLGLTDDMLAGLLGHEIAHVTQEHFLRMRKRATLLNALSQLVAVGAIAVASKSRSDSSYPSPYPYPLGRSSSNSADLAQGAAAASLVVTELLLRSYSRENEDESDEEGQRLMAAAGYDPKGTRELMALMSERLPQTRTYGYWRTHPFFEERILAAEARQGTFKVKQSTKPVETYRQKSQTELLAFSERDRLTPPMVEVLKRSALAAWPQGDSADQLRVEELHRQRQAELDKVALSRNFGSLIRAYRHQIEEISARTPASPALVTLRNELGELQGEARRLYPSAAEVVAGGVFETDFLKTFLSNFPDAKEAPKVALHLGLAYSRLGQETEAVENLLRAWEEDPTGDPGREAMAGLRNLAPYLEQLGALAQLASQDRDPELRELAAQRLEQRASKYKEVKNGAEYLHRFPDGEYVARVTERLNTLADNLYKEMVLYQQIGDTARAIDRAKSILTHAPYSPAAERLSAGDLSQDDPA